MEREAIFCPSSARVFASQQTLCSSEILRPWSTKAAPVLTRHFHGHCFVSVGFLKAVWTRFASQRKCDPSFDFVRSPLLRGDNGSSFFFV